MGLSAPFHIYCISVEVMIVAAPIMRQKIVRVTKNAVSGSRNISSSGLGPHNW